MDLVEYESVRNELKGAQQQIAEGKFKDALSQCCLAFHHLLSEYESTIRNHFGLSPFPFGGHTGYFRFHSTGLSEFADVRGLIDEIRSSFESIETYLKIITLGLDGRKYAKFRMLTPFATKMLDGHYDLTWGRTRRNMTFTKDDAQFCLDFVIEAALILRQFDFEGRGSVEAGEPRTPRRKR